MYIIILFHIFTISNKTLLFLIIDIRIILYYINSVIIWHMITRLQDIIPIYIMIRLYSTQLTLSNTNTIRPTRLELIRFAILLLFLNIISFDLVIF